MKRLIKEMVMFLSLLAVLFIITICAARAEDVKKKDFDFTVRGVYTIYQDRDLREDGTGVKGELRYKWFYLWGSWERTELRLTGQRAGGIDLFGVGLGGKVTLLKPISLFVEAGYYIPNADLQKKTQVYAEGVYYKWYRTLNEIGLQGYASQFTQYKYELKSNFGGSVGLEVNQQIYKGLSVNLFGAYRFLNLKENWDAYHSTIPGCYIQTKEKRSFSGGQFGAGLSYKF
jgi:hypothetical protein